jgi:hypothetical protein
MLKTFEEACDFVLQNKVVTIFGSKSSPFPSLWDNTALSEEKPKEGGWCEKVVAVWAWKNEIPGTLPDEIFYGKLPGGDAVLMEMEYLRTVHYPKYNQPVEELYSLSQGIFEYIRVEPWFTGDLRKLAMAELSCTKSRFDTALKRLQISLNIARSNDPSLKKDQWLVFSDLYPDIARDDCAE